MEKIITIDGRQVKFKSTGAFLLRYKAQFHRDALKDIYKMQKAFKVVHETVIDETTKEEKQVAKQVIQDIEAMDLEIFYNLIWTLAKTADKSIEPPFEWLDSFNEFPLNDIVTELEDLIFTCMGSTVESKKK